MQVVNKVLSKWNKKTELANHKISLNLQADINKVLDEIEDSLEFIRVSEEILDEKSFKVKNAIDDFNTVVNTYEQSAKNSKSDITNAKQVKKKVEEIAKDLGVDPSGVKNYNLIEKYVTELEDEIKKVPSVIKGFSNFK